MILCGISKPDVIGKGFGAFLFSKNIYLRQYVFIQYLMVNLFKIFRKLLCISINRKNIIIDELDLSDQEQCSADVNSDGVINILDIVLLVNIILGILDPTDLQENASDINNDGIINILDVVQIVNMILN